MRIPFFSSIGERLRGKNGVPATVEPKHLQRTEQPIVKNMPAAIGSGVTRNPQWRDWSTQHAFYEGYRESSWVYICTEKRRRAVASVPWYVEVKNREGEWERAPAHPLQTLLDDPNPDMNQRELMSRLSQWLDLGGNAYWIKVRGGPRKQPLELWPAMPDSMRVIPGRERLVQAYRFEWGDDRRTFDAEDVLHFKTPNPGDLYYGHPPLRSIGKAVDIDREAQDFQKVSMQNRGIPDGVFTLDDETTDDQWRAAREQVREQYQTKDAQRAPWVVARATWNQMSLSPADLDFMQGRGMTRVEICAGYDTPPPMVGLYDDATLANIESAKRIFWEDGMLPLLEDLQAHLNFGIAREFGTADQIRIVYDVSNVDALREKYQEKVEAGERLWKMGVSFAEINQRLELGFSTEDMPGSDIGYVPAGMIPVQTGEPLEGGSEGGEGIEGEAPSADPSESLNGAQVDAILRIVEQVAVGSLPRESAVAMLRGAFPISEEQAEDILGEVGRSFFVDPPDPNGGSDQRSITLPDDVKDRLERYRKRTADELAHMAYGSR